MKTFKEFLIKQVDMEKNFEIIKVDDYLVIIFHENGLKLLTEAIRKGQELVKDYTSMVHKGNIDPRFKHIHVYKKGNHLFAMNIDGTAHDKSHKTRIPNKVADAIRKKHPEFQIPQDNFIENLEISLEEKNSIRLLENNDLFSQ
jgi:hypothetical protein